VAGEHCYVQVRRDLLEALIEGRVRVSGRLRVGRYILKRKVGRVVPEEGGVAEHGHQGKG